MAGNQISLEILAEVKKATQSLDKLSTDAKKSFGNIEKESKTATAAVEKSFSSLSSSVGSSLKLIGAAAAAAVAFIAGREIIGAFNDAIAAASAEEDAINQLNTALALTGRFTEAASQELVDYADSLEKTTKFSGEAVLGASALIQNLARLDKEGLKQATTAATDLSAALGIDLQSAAQLVGKAAEGNVESFKRYGIQIKEGKNNAETLSNTLKTLNERFGGAAASQLNTYSGATAQLSNAFEDVYKSIGRTVVQNPAVIAAIQAITSSFSALAESLDGIGPIIQDFIGSVIELAFKALPYLVDYIERNIKALLFLREAFLTVALAVTSLISAFLDIGLVQKVFATFIDNLKTGLLGIIALISTALGAFAKIPGVAKYLDPVISKIDDLGTGLAGVDADGAVQSIKNGVDTLGVSLASSLNDSDRLFKSVTDGAERGRQFVKGLNDKFKETRDSIAAGGREVKNLNQAFSSSLSEATATTSGATPAPATQAPVGKPATTNANATPTKAEASTFEKVASAISSAISTGAEILNGVLGGGYLEKISNFVSELGNAPAKFVEIAKGFGEIIANLFESLPKVAEAITNELPNLFSKIAAALPKLAEAIIPVFQKLAGVIADAAPALAEGILDAITKLVEAIPSIVDRLVQALPKLLRAILQKLPALITAIAKAIPQLVKSIASVIPELIVVIAENLAPIVLALVQGILEAIPEIVLALVDVFIVKGGLFKIIFAIIKAIPQIAIALVQGIVRAAVNSTGELFKFFGKSFSSSIKLPKFDLGDTRDILTGKKAFDKIKELFEKYKDVLTGKDFMNRVRDGFQKIFDKLKDVLKLDISGGGRGGGIFSFAKGGVVPQSPVYAAKGFFERRGSDTVPAMLTPGELVIPKDPTARLMDFLDRVERSGLGGGIDMDRLARVIESRPANINVSIGEEQFARASFNVKRRGYR